MAVFYKTSKEKLRCSMKIKVILSLFFLSIMCLNAYADDKEKVGSDMLEQKTTAKAKEGINSVPNELLPGILAKDVEIDLMRMPKASLTEMLKNSENRYSYLSGLFAEKELQKIVKKKKLDQDKSLQIKFITLKNNIYIDELVKEYLNERSDSLLALAKDKYETNKDTYSTRRKIKIAQIYISKFERDKEKIRKNY